LEREEKWREFWEKEGIYNFNPSSKGKVFSVDTPPPYLSAAHLHAGHAMSYTQAEFVVRYKRMRGFNIFYPMGFDDNGLPTERFVEKKYNVDKAKITRSEFIKLCLDETAAGSKVYKDFFSRLGISVDWSLLYSTIDERSQSVAQRSFIDLYKKNLIDYRKEPVIWCPFCRTALSLFCPLRR
jgi:valyl-tRNA synthetase